MVTIKFICVIAGARIIKLRSCIILSFLNGLQSFATACQPEMSEGPQQAELGSGYHCHTMLPILGSPGTQRPAADMVGQGDGCHYTGAERFLWHTCFHGSKSYIEIMVEDPLPSYHLKTDILSKQMLNCSSLDTGYGTLGINKRRLLKYGLNTLSSAVWWLWSQNRFASLPFYFFICFPFGQGG